MDKTEILKKITEKRDFSQLPVKDVEMAFEHFQRRECVDEEKIRLTRDLLRKVFSAFTSGKLLSLKDKEPGWVLRKHISTRERLEYYSEIYKRIFNKLNKKNKQLTVFDLGAGINGFSYNYLPKEINYIGIESIGQLVDLMNYYFKNHNLKAKAIHESLFEIDKIKKYISQAKGDKIIFLFKIIDSLEMIEGDYSKKLLLSLTPLVDRVVLSFATRSLMKKEKFKVNRSWIINFIKENFVILDEFDFGGEKYIVFSTTNV
jgi:hypothetical protein